MKNLKNSFTKEMKKYDTSWMWILYVVSLVGLVLVFWNLLEEGLKYQILYFGTIIFFFLFLLPILALNFKRRALYDPKLNMIYIQSIQGMENYLDTKFIARFGSHKRYEMYLESIEISNQDRMFIYLTPCDISYAEYHKLLVQIIGYEFVTVVSFIKEKEGDRIGIKFWTFGSDEAKVIYPELKFNS